MTNASGTLRYTLADFDECCPKTMVTFVLKSVKFDAISSDYFYRNDKLDLHYARLFIFKASQYRRYLINKIESQSQTARKWPIF